jgi:phenylalanyl-tRNA synthetase alpha chain
MDNISQITESLSPNERKILPLLKEKSINDICKKSNLDTVSVMRSIEYLQNKKLVEINTKINKIVDVGVNGALYRKQGLPERRLLQFLEENKRLLTFEEAQNGSKLSDNEFNVALGVLKKKALIEVKNGKIVLNVSQEEISRKTLEEKFLEKLPIDFDELSSEDQYSLQSLKSRKDIIDIREQKIIQLKITELGEKIMHESLKQADKLIEHVTPQLIKSSSWKGKKFRRYDVESPVPNMYTGKRHFVNQSLDYARKIWIEMGFEEMTGPKIVSSFWNFDALFTAQDHPVREMQDTFFIDKLEELPEKKIVKAVKQAHEQGVGGSKGWNYSWDEKEAKRLILRTHTTCLSAKTLSELDVKKDLPKKYFAIGKTFRNETIDWSHEFEFYQSEGIVIDKKVNFRHLLGYLKEFYEKMGFKQIRFTPAYFPYTEPSVEIHVFHPEKKIWLELGGAGIFRPEITIPLLGEDIPVLAWGQGFDRIIIDFYKIKDLRELYQNDINQLREMKWWTK